MKKCIECKKRPMLYKLTKLCGTCYMRNLRYEARTGKQAMKHPKALPILPSMFSQEQEQLVIGGLLGDMWLQHNRDCKNARLGCKRSAVDRTYLRYEYDILKEICGSKIRTGWATHPDDRSIKLEQVEFQTRSSELFTALRKQWYPKGNKVIPKDLILTPLIVAIWFADDGSICYQSGEKKVLTLRFYTNSFTKKEVQFLARLLQEAVGAKFNVYKVYGKKCQWVIGGGHCSTLALIKYMGNQFPKSMRRKLKHAKRWL